MKVRIKIIFTILFLSLGIQVFCQKNHHISSDKEIDVLISKMTLAQKKMQLQIRSYETIKRFVSADGTINPDSLRKVYPDGLGGMNIDINLQPEIYVKVANQLQDFSTKHGSEIPMVFVGEGLHGFMARGATVFPQAIALGCSWDIKLAERVFSAAALEARSRGVSQILSPVLDLAREPRFGRTEEMYSEDPYLVAMMGEAAVNGFQGRTDQPDINHVGTTLKHFMGHGQPEGGRNTAPINASEYDLMNDHLFPFEYVIKNAKPLSIMPSYNEINGVPNHANRWLLKKLLREQLGYNGLITSDQNAIDQVFKLHAFAGSDEEAALLALNNSIDVDLQYSTGTFDRIDALIKSGKLSEGIIDNALRRFLKFKMVMGLFDHPFSDVKKMITVTNGKAHQKIALEAAEKSAVLLKNRDQLLPLNPNKIKTLAVIGPLAKGVHFGGYTAEPRNGVDLLSGIVSYAGSDLKVLYSEGCKIAKEEASFWQNNVHTPTIESEDRKLIREAVGIAEKSDIIILALGETESFSREAWGEDHRGDRTDISLLGLQNELVKELLVTGKPIVVILFGGRPLAFNFVSEQVSAIIQAFYLGQETGNALANIIFGKVNPSGKLSVTIPKSVGELPVYYDRKPSRNRSYINEESLPLYPFGFGKSYTVFEYSKPVLNRNTIKINESLIVTFKITNTGQFAGEEIAQMYIHDEISSGTRPVIELKDFARVSLKPGQTKEISFTITPDKLMFYNYKFEKVIEPGAFKVLIGQNSQELQSVDFIVE